MRSVETPAKWGWHLQTTSARSPGPHPSAPHAHSSAPEALQSPKRPGGALGRGIRAGKTNSLEDWGQPGGPLGQGEGACRPTNRAPPLTVEDSGRRAPLDPQNRAGRRRQCPYPLHRPPPPPWHPEAPKLENGRENGQIRHRERAQHVKIGRWSTHQGRFALQGSGGGTPSGRRGGSLSDPSGLVKVTPPKSRIPLFSPRPAETLVKCRRWKENGSHQTQFSLFCSAIEVRVATKTHILLTIEKWASLNINS